jgi:hypothetical protein
MDAYWCFAFHYFCVVLMDYYSKGLSPVQAAFAVKKYKSHCHVGPMLG